MAKSIRSKTKRAFRRVKRESGVFAAADAARLHRLSTRLRAKFETDQEGDRTIPETSEKIVEGDETDNGVSPAAPTDDVMEQDGSTSKNTTSGRGLSRRESRRLSKGKSVRKKKNGGVAKPRAGRPKRRR